MEKQKRKIVIVDDERIITDTLKMLLSLEFSDEICTFNSPVEALEFIQHNGADVVLSDFLMPQMNGIEFLTQVKKIVPYTCMIMLTGYADKENAIKAINEIGIHRYIEKPWSNTDLILAVRNGFERTELINKLTLEQEMNKLRDDFIATLTHDLRTPLLAAIQTLKFFLDGTLGELNDKQKQFLDTMLTSNKDMLGLVNALLEVYKYESGQLVLCKDKFLLNTLLAQCVEELKPLADNKKVSIEYDEGAIEIFADKQELRRVVSNLLGNAINHTQAGDKITISAKIAEDNVLVSVEDTGVGIPQEDIPNMFRRFSQGTKSKRSTGTGLGLYLSRQIIEAHQGKISLKSELGKGSVFTFELPLGVALNV
jgi:signal transduction histidine kinase